MMLSCCRDLIFSTKIRSTAEHLGVPFRGAATPKAVADRLNQVDDGRLNQPVTGVLVDMEMGGDALAIIRQVKEHSPAVPVIAFGSHVAVELLAAARDAGADAVMPRSQFTAQLPALLQQYGGAQL